jgi:aarF domain-containing kinase
LNNNFGKLISLRTSSCFLCKYTMSRLLATGRCCLRQWPRQGSRQHFSPCFRSRFFHSSAPRAQRFSGPRKLLFASATLTPAAFVLLSQSDGSKDDKTGEELMLEASRHELDQQLPKAIEHSKGMRRRVYFFIDLYIYEPFCTTLRFFHLVIIFVPVIVTIPALWIGKRLPDRDNERSGTLWWYGFLVSSMERAGAAFIKVTPIIAIAILGLRYCSSVNGQRPEQTYFRPRCVASCPRCIPTRLHTPLK